MDDSRLRIKKKHHKLNANDLKILSVNWIAVNFLEIVEINLIRLVILSLLCTDDAVEGIHYINDRI